MAQIKKLQLDIENLEIYMPPELKGGVYANTVNFAASDAEVTINFMYANPTDKPQATLVSRVIIPYGLVDKLSESLNAVSEATKNQGDK